MGISSSHLQESTSPATCLVPLVLSISSRRKERETSSEDKNVTYMLRNNLGKNPLPQVCKELGEIGN